MVVEQEVGYLARHSFVAVHLHLVGLGPVRTTITNIPHCSLYLTSSVTKGINKDSRQDHSNECLTDSDYILTILSNCEVVCSVKQ